MFKMFKKKEERLLQVTTAPQSMIYSSLSTPALSIPAVYACVSLISNTVASLPLEIFANDIKQPKHPKAKLINEPIENMTRFTWVNTIVRNILVEGNAYVEITKKGLIIYDSRNVTLLVDDLGDIVSYQVATIKSQKRTVKQEDMLHFKGLTKGERGQIGLNISEAFQLLFGEIKATSQHTSDYMQKGAISPIWLQVPGRVQPDKLELLRTRIAEIYQGITNRVNIPVITDGMEFKEIKANTLNDGSIDKLKGIQLKEVAMIFNVPLSMLDSSEGGSYGSAVEANLMFLKSCIAPLLRNIESELNLKLNTGIDDKYKFDTNSYLAGSFAQQVETLANAVSSGLLTSNEARERLGYKEHQDGTILFAPAGTPTAKEPNTITEKIEA